MASSQPGRSASFPNGQARQEYARDWGNYTTVAGMPNGSGNAVPLGSFFLEAGDTCYLSLNTGEAQYMCISPGSAGTGNAVWVPSSGQGPWSSVLYVDQVRGSDTTGQRGNANRPFATIQAALNAALTDDTVWLAPQRFTLTQALTIPNTIVRLTIMGTTTNPGSNALSAQQPCTIIIGANLNRIDVSTNTALARLSVENLSFANATAGFYSIKADGTTANLTALQIFINNVAGANIFAKRIGAVTGWNCTASGTNVLAGVIAILTAQSLLTGATTFSYDVSTDPAAGGLLLVQNGSTIGALTLTGQPNVVGDQTSTFTSIVGSGLLAPASGKQPAISICGFAGNVDFASAGAELPDTATALTVDFSAARFVTSNGIVTTPATAIKFKVAGAAANAQTVKLNDTITGPGCTITANQGANIVGRGASWPTTTLSTPDASGSITPPQLWGTVSLAAGGTVAHTWAGDLGITGLTRTGVAADSGSLVSKTQGADAVVSVLATTGFTTIATAQAGNTAALWGNIWK